MKKQKIELLSWHAIVVCGMKGTGKTYLEKNALIPKYERVFIFDPNEEFQEYKKQTYVPETDSPQELNRVASQLWKEGNVTLVVSEAELYLPVQGQLPPSIFKIITRGRHRNIGLVADTRRIANLNKTVFGLAEHAFIFRHFSPTDIEYLQKFVPANCRSLASLPDFHFWHYHKGTVEACSPVKIHK